MRPLVLSILFLSQLACQSQSQPSATTDLQFKPVLEHLQKIGATYFETSYEELFKSFCEENELKDSKENKDQYFQIKFLHDLFTCQGAWNGARGGILRTPYFWHWVTPNPRHSIISTSTKKPIHDEKPPTGFGNYATKADIDRTPDLYLQDLFTEKASYQTEALGEFFSFGWCSEREMAHVQIMNIMGYQNGKVVVSGNHSWSEYLIPFISAKGDTVSMHFKIDNTFDGIVTKAFSTSEAEKWSKSTPTGKLPLWYQKKASDSKISEKVKNITVPKERIYEIEVMIKNYFKDQ
jgi:hypothetical protein